MDRELGPKCQDLVDIDAWAGQHPIHLLDRMPDIQAAGDRQAAAIVQTASEAVCITPTTLQQRLALVASDLRRGLTSFLTKRLGTARR